MNLIKKGLKYIRYFLFSKNRKGHGIHSPFVYGFVRNILNDKKEYEAYKIIENILYDLKNNNAIVEIENFGAGSKINKNLKRKISDLAKNNSIKKKYGRLLFRLVQYYKPQEIIELGTSLGISSLYMALASKSAQVHTIEGCKNTLNVAKQIIKKANISNIQYYNSNFDTILPDVLKKEKTFDLAFIDGNHKKEAVLKYFYLFKKYIHNNSILIFDDINWSNDMNEAWKIICSDKSVTVTINIFQMGIVFFRKESSKQDFTIKF
ncbi:MAG: class I SAM-dependent methyltransferase [Chlorobi bacterium]|nr:class I SAM-dependent methyltransferase [Chlorobiota bacterium]